MKWMVKMPQEKRNHLIQYAQIKLDVRQCSARIAFSAYTSILSRRESKEYSIEPVLFDPPTDVALEIPGFARGRLFSTQVLTGCGRGLSGFACTFFGLARGIGAASFFLFFPSFIESVSASSHKNVLLLLLAQSVP